MHQNNDPQYHRASALILAGGEARRMNGQNKGLLNFSGSTFIERKIEMLLGLTDEILIVTNSPETYTGFDVKVVADEVPGGGVLAALYTGLKSCNFDYVFATTADTPFLKNELVSTLIRRAAGGNTRTEDEPPPDVILPVWEDKIEPLCAVYNKRCLRAMKNALHRNEKKIRSFYKDVTVRYVPQEEIEKIDPKGESFININTEDDYLRYFTRTGKRRV